MLSALSPERQTKYVQHSYDGPAKAVNRKLQCCNRACRAAVSVQFDEDLFRHGHWHDPQVPISSDAGHGVQWRGEKATCLSDAAAGRTELGGTILHEARLLDHAGRTPVSPNGNSPAPGDRQRCEAHNCQGMPSDRKADG